MIVLGCDPAIGVAKCLEFGRAEGHGAVAIAALAVANRAVDPVSLAAPLEQIHRHLARGSASRNALTPGLPSGRSSLRLDAFRPRAGRSIRRRASAAASRWSIMCGLSGSLTISLFTCKVGAGRHARQPRTHRPAIGKHRVAPLGTELLLLEHVLDRMHRRLGRRLRAGQRNQSEGHQARKQCQPRRNQGLSSCAFLMSLTSSTAVEFVSSNSCRACSRRKPGSRASMMMKKPSSVTRRNRGLLKAGK